MEWLADVPPGEEAELEDSEVTSSSLKLVTEAVQRLLIGKAWRCVCVATGVESLFKMREWVGMHWWGGEGHTPQPPCEMHPHRDKPSDS